MNLSTKKEKKFLTIQRMSLISVLTALMVVCSWISVPNPFNPSVPFTLQTLAIILTGLILSPFEAFFTSVVYFMLGIINLPIFSNFTTFYSKLGTASFGYIIGFFITPFLVSLTKTLLFKLVDKKPKKALLHTIIYFFVAIVVGILAIDIPGVIVGKLVTQGDWGVIIVGFALSFMATDVLKCVTAALLASALEKPLKKIRKN